MKKIVDSYCKTISVPQFQLQHAYVTFKKVVQVLI